jgi:DNA-binding response OmpR family regulator
MLLEAEGYQVHSADNETQAKAIVEERRIDLSIIDYVLEDASGVGIARALKRIDESHKIIFLSGSIKVLDVVDTLEFRVSKVFLKPIDPIVFLDTVHTVLMEPDHVDQDTWIEKRSIL